jgi:hypothetical protein
MRYYDKQGRFMSFYVNPHGHQCPWYPHAEMLGAPNLKYCEETLCQLISEPANTWSNLAYLVAAILIFWMARRYKQIELNLFAPIMLFLGTVSFIYHMSNNYLSQVFDFIGMFFLVYWIFILNLKRMGLVDRKHYLTIMLSLTIASTIVLHVMYLNFIKYQYLIFFAVIAIAITEYLIFRKNPAKNYQFFAIGFGCIVVAKIFSLLDLNRIMCDPTNHWLQGHALWHIFGAIGLTFIYKHYEQFDFSPNLYKEEIESQLEV